MKHKSEVDVAVLLLFFTRTRVTTFTFEQIRKARPARLYLYQDGPREGRPDDVENIKKCRDTVESMIVFSDYFPNTVLQKTQLNLSISL